MSFLPPQLEVGNLDRFLVRQANLNRLTAQRSQLHGVLLDVGCGRMPYKPLLMQPGTRISQYIGLDLADSRHRSSPPDIAWTPDGLIPLDSASVDSAICTEVLEHCPNPDQVLREVFRVMRPNGIFFFTVPFLWNLHEAPHDEYRYKPFALERLLRSAGFSAIKIEATGGWHASMAQMLGLWVRRSPLSPRKRRVLSHLLKPLIGYLVKKDVPPKVFKEGTMITGLCGTARKPAQPG